MLLDPDGFVAEIVRRLRPERLLERPEIGEAVDALGPRVALICLGKPARDYAAVLEERLKARLAGSCVVGLHGGHPIPNEESIAAGQRLLKFVEAVPDDTALLCFVAGGGSALAEVPRAPFTIDQIRQRTRELIESGASIDALNRVRASMSRIKKGALLENCRASRVLTLVLTDIPSGDPALVASGPTIRPGEPVIRVAGYAELAAIAADLLPGAVVTDPFDAPIEWGIQAHLAAVSDLDPGGALLSGGELPTRVVGSGRGGRNTEFVIRMGAELADRPGRWRVLSFATDGSDGNSGSAGGWIEASALRGIDVQPWLERSDSATLLAAHGTLFPPVATATNLMDLRIVARHL